MAIQEVCRVVSVDNLSQ
uniref:Uncharacterized protein n=1 Tax=Anguilla anguilla TaxID=7936 RepID=A0A0E9VA06_ANGAN